MALPEILTRNRKFNGFVYFSSAKQILKVNNQQNFWGSQSGASPQLSFCTAKGCFAVSYPSFFNPTKLFSKCETEKVLTPYPKLR